MEQVLGLYVFPTEIDQKHYNYQIYYRQKTSTTGEAEEIPEEGEKSWQLGPLIMASGVFIAFGILAFIGIGLLIGGLVGSVAQMPRYDRF